MYQLTENLGGTGENPKRKLFYMLNVLITFSVEAQQ